MTPHRAPDTLAAVREQAALRRDALLLAAETGIDPRACRRAVLLGAEALRAIADQLRIDDAAQRLGIVLGRQRRRR